MAFPRSKVLIAAAAFAIAAGLLTVAGLNGGWVYYMSVDQFTSTESHHGQRVRLHGVVGADNFESSSVMLLARFNLEGPESSLRVEYQGVIPAMFRPGHDVVVEGLLGSDGVFQADTLMTKCGSRYESEGEAPHDHPRGEGAAP